MWREFFGRTSLYAASAPYIVLNLVLKKIPFLYHKKPESNHIPIKPFNSVGDGFDCKKSSKWPDLAVALNPAFVVTLSTNGNLYINIIGVYKENRFWVQMLLMYSHIFKLDSIRVDS